MDNLDFEDDWEAKNVPLMDPLDISALISPSGTEFEINFKDLNLGGEEETSYRLEDVYEYTKPDCCGIVDEEVYQDCEPFELIASKMEDLYDNGKIKKRIIREGYGDKLPDKGLVTVNYNAYLEYNDEPFDSTYLRKRSFNFCLNNEETLLGLDIAVQSMKIGEKSQFLIDPAYAYGKLGCLQRIPPDAMVLFEIEVKNCVDSGAAITYENLNKKEQQDFSSIYKYAHSLCLNGNDLFGKKMYRLAAKDYNFAISKLERCNLKNYEEQEKQQKLLLRIYTNLAVTHTKQEEPRRACIACNNIYRICKKTFLKVPVKVYFNHGRCLIMFSDFKEAEQKLKIALKLEPQNIEIMNELKVLEEKRAESYKKDVAMAKATFQDRQDKKPVISEDFKKAVEAHCKALIADADSKRYGLPGKLTLKELMFCKNEVLRYGLEIKNFKEQDKYNYYIVKPSKNNN